MSLESDGGMIWQGKPEELGEKPVPVPLCPPQIPHGLTRARTWASAVRGRRLTTWVMARSQCLRYCTVSQIQQPKCHSCYDRPQIRNGWKQLLSSWFTHQHSVRISCQSRHKYICSSSLYPTCRAYPLQQNKWPHNVTTHSVLLWPKYLKFTLFHQRNTQNTVFLFSSTFGVHPMLRPASKYNSDSFSLLKNTEKNRGSKLQEESSN
jgi:hypothetical protein